MPTRKIAALLLGCLFAFALATTAVAAEKNSWRVEGQLIRVGDSKGKVLAVAGDPDSKETLQEAVDVGKEGSEPVKVDVWYYRNEAKRKLHTIHFRDSKVSKIQWERY